MNSLGVIIVAGGSGTRMAAEVGEGGASGGAMECGRFGESGGICGKDEGGATNIKKQFLLLCGTPILMHTISKFNSLYPDCEIVVVIAEDQHRYWQELCKQHNFSTPHKLANGGSTRFYSVQNALQAVGNVDFIAVHDGVRPLVSQQVIHDAIAAAQQYGAAVPVVMPVDSLREVIKVEKDNAVEVGKTKTVDRERFRAVQTPQVFRSDWLQKAYRQEYKTEFTDDASVVESAGYEVVLTPGDRNNIKITTKIDLYLAELIETVSNAKTTNFHH